MLVIIEGENKCGKTTLAKHIEKEHGFRYIKVSQPGEKGPYREYMDLLDSLKPGEHAVIDRFHIGEEVYGPLYRGKSGLIREQFGEIDKRIDKSNGILIHCFDSYENIAKRFEEENEEFADKSKIQKTLDLFDIVIKRSRIPVYKHKIGGRMDLLKSGEIDKIIKQYLFIEKN